MHYLAKIEPDGDGYLVTFPYIPEAITGGGTEAEALANAVDALEVALLTYAGDGRKLPAPTGRRGEEGREGDGGRKRRISVSAAVGAKVAFIAAFHASGSTRVALAAKLGKTESEIRRMLDPYHNTKLGTIEAGLRALGKRLVVVVEEGA